MTHSIEGPARSSTQEAAAIAAAIATEVTNRNAAIAAALANPFDYAETFDPNLGASLVPSQNFTYLMAPVQGKLVKAFAFTNVRVYNHATINGNFAISIWTSDGTTATRLVGTGSVAQSGANAVQTVALSGTVPALTEWFVSFSSDSATGTYNCKTAWAGTNKSASNKVKAAAIAGFNVTAAQTLAGLTSGLRVWVEVS